MTPTPRFPGLVSGEGRRFGGLTSSLCLYPLCHTVSPGGMKSPGTLPASCALLSYHPTSHLAGLRFCCSVTWDQQLQGEGVSPWFFLHLEESRAKISFLQTGTLPKNGEPSTSNKQGQASHAVTCVRNLTCVCFQKTN